MATGKLILEVSRDGIEWEKVWETPDPFVPSSKPIRIKIKGNFGKVKVEKDIIKIGKG